MSCPFSLPHINFLRELHTDFNTLEKTILFVILAKLADDVDDIIDFAHCFAGQNSVEIAEILPYFIIIDTTVFDVDEIQNFKQGRGCGGVVIEVVIRQELV